MFYKEILLLHKPYTLHTLTREIQRQSGITFSYNAALINPSQKVKLSKRLDRMTVKELLGLLRKKTGVGYRIVNQSHIIYTAANTRQRSKGKQSKPEKRRSATRPDDREPDTSEPDNGQPETQAAAGKQPATQEAQPAIVIVGDSVLAMSYYISGGGGGGAAYGGAVAPKYPVTAEQAGEESTEDDREEDRDLRRSGGRGGFYTPLGQSATVRFLKERVLLAGGLSADELYYLNPTVRAGFSFLYGTIAYNVGPFAHWRYGLGSMFSIDERWNFRLEVNTGGPLRSPYNLQAFDTTRIPIDSGQVQLVITERNTPLIVQSTLTRFVLGVEWNVTGNLSLGGSLVLNRLHTTYASNGSPVTLSDILPIGIDADEKYRTINPPYLLGNSYSGNSTSNTKIWMGIQLSLIYKLSFFDR